jgi:hypothetical protein
MIKTIKSALIFSFLIITSIFAISFASSLEFTSAPLTHCDIGGPWGWKANACPSGTQKLTGPGITGVCPLNAIPFYKSGNFVGCYYLGSNQQKGSPHNPCWDFSHDQKDECCFYLCQQITSIANITGLVEEIDYVANNPTIAGWAFDPINPSTSISIHIYANNPSPQGTLITTIQTTTPRPDINAEQNITGIHGFNWTIPEQYRVDGQKFYFYAFNQLNSSRTPILLQNSPVTFVIDTTAPSQITHLIANELTQDSITWSWTNPIDSDFDHTLIYLNNNFIVQLPKGVHSFQAENLQSDTIYTLAVKTVDFNSNINQNAVTNSAKTLSEPNPEEPTLFLNIESPMNKVYNTTSILINMTSKNASSVEFSVNGQTYNYLFPLYLSLPEGTYDFSATAINGTTSLTKEVSFSISLPNETITNNSNAPVITDIYTIPSPIINNGSKQTIEVHLTSDQSPWGAIIFLYNSNAEIVKSSNYDVISPAEVSSSLNFEIPSGLTDGDYYLVLSAFNLEGNYSLYYVNDVLVNSSSHNICLPVSAITNLVTITRTNSTIVWKWINPISNNFSKNIVYINGINVGNTTINQYTAINLNPNTTYTISVKTLSSCGNLSIAVSDSETTLSKSNKPINHDDKKTNKNDTFYSYDRSDNSDSATIPLDLSYLDEVENLSSQNLKQSKQPIQNSILAIALIFLCLLMLILILLLLFFKKK